MSERDEILEAASVVGVVYRTKRKIKKMDEIKITVERKKLWQERNVKRKRHDVVREAKHEYDSNEEGDDDDDHEEDDDDENDDKTRDGLKSL